MSGRSIFYIPSRWSSHISLGGPGSYRPSSPFSSIQPFCQKQLFPAVPSVQISKKTLWPTIFPRKADRIPTFPLAMNLLDLGQMWIYLDGIRWEGISNGVLGRLSLGWLVVCWVWRFGILMFGVEEGGKGWVGGGVSYVL